MYWKKTALLASICLLFLAGCGQEENSAVTGENANVAAQTPDADGIEGDEGDEDDDEDPADTVRYALSPAEMVEEMKKSCATGESMVFYSGLDKADAQRLCSCFYDEAFGKLSKVEWTEWMDEADMRGKLLKNFSKGEKPDAAAEARLDASNKKWTGLYAKSENYCIQKLGLKVEPVYRNY